MIESHASFYVPKTIEAIKNSILIDLLLDAFTEKGENPTFIVNGQKIVFPESKYSSRRLADYKKKLIIWAENPHVPPDNIEALGLEMLVKLMLKEALKNNKNIVVVQSPATLDFIDKSDHEEWGPTCDILIGKKRPDGIVPIALIGTSLTAHAGERKNLKLNVPIFSISGNKLFNTREQFYINIFASHPQPDNFAESLAQRSPFKERLEKITAKFS